MHVNTGRSLSTVVVMAGLVWTQTAAAGSLVYPHALFTSDREPSTVFFVQNSGQVPAEVEISLSFGYPATDSLGEVHIELIENPASTDPSAAAWVRALPRRMLIQPGAMQAVRVLAQPPDDLTPGEYWCRIIVTARDIRPPRLQAISGEIQVGLRLETRTIISLSYRRPEVTTGVRLAAFRASYADGAVFANLDLQRLGNAAYLGQVKLDLCDDQGDRLGHWDRVIAVYYDFHRSLRCPVADLPPGRYVLRAVLSTDRKDIPLENVIAAESLEASTELWIQ